MTAPVSRAGKLVCESCGSTLPYDPRLAGKKCRCGKCGSILSVPMEPSEVPSVPQPTPTDASQIIQFHCVACQRHLKAKSEHAGKLAKCPKCGASTHVPATATHVAQTPLPINTGDEYELWGVDEAPSPAELIARQPILIPVYCLNCNTLMYAQAEQVGQKIECPDCGARTLVKVPPVTKKRPPVLSPGGDEYFVEVTTAPVEKHVPLYVKRLQEESRKQVEESAKKQRDECPPMPALPTVQGVWAMMFCSTVVNWWVGLSLVSWAMGWGLLLMMTAASSGLGAILIIFVVAFMCVAGSIFYCGFSAIASAILTDSSDGHRQLNNPPNTNFTEWTGAAGYFAVALAVSLIPGSLMVNIAALPHAFALASMLLFFPIILLSMLEQGSPFAILSPKILASLPRRLHHWLLFYVESTLVLGLAGTIFYGALWTVSMLALMLASPVVLWLLLLYFRILGRFAWWLSEE